MPFTSLPALLPSRSFSSRRKKLIKSLHVRFGIKRTFFYTFPLTKEKKEMLEWGVRGGVKAVVISCADLRLGEQSVVLVENKTKSFPPEKNP